MAKNQWFTGNAPDEEKYKKVGEVAGFEVWEKIDSGGEWINIKLASIKKRLAKANFWIAWSKQQQRTAAGRDIFLLKEKSEKEYKDLIKFMQETYPYEW